MFKRNKPQTTKLSSGQGFEALPPLSPFIPFPALPGPRWLSPVPGAFSGLTHRSIKIIRGLFTLNNSEAFIKLFQSCGPSPDRAAAPHKCLIPWLTSEII